MDPGHLISWKRYGNRMIGSAGDRADAMRARYLGAPLPPNNAGPLNLTNTSTTPIPFVGEGSAPAPAPKRVVLSFGPLLKPAAPPPPKVITFGPLLAPASSPLPPALTVTAPAPVSADAPADCPWTNARVAKVGALAAVGGGIAGGLLMYLVGLSTREHKNKRRRRR